MSIVSFCLRCPQLAGCENRSGEGQRRHNRSIVAVKPSSADRVLTVEPEHYLNSIYAALCLISFNTDTSSVTFAAGNTPSGPLSLMSINGDS